MKQCLISKTISPIYNLTETTRKHTDMQTHTNTRTHTQNQKQSQINGDIN